MPVRTRCRAEPSWTSGRPSSCSSRKADLWLTPLTGVRPETYDGVRSDVLDQADRVLRERLEQDADADEDGPLLGIVTMTWSARRSAAKGDLAKAAVLSHWRLTDLAEVRPLAG